MQPVAKELLALLRRYVELMEQGRFDQASACAKEELWAELPLANDECGVRQILAKKLQAGWDPKNFGADKEQTLTLIPAYVSLWLQCFAEGLRNSS